MRRRSLSMIWSDIYAVRRTVDGYGPAGNLGAPVNIEHSQGALHYSQFLVRYSLFLPAHHAHHEFLQLKFL